MKDLLKPIAALFFTCLIVTSLLAVTNYYTAPVIQQNEGGKADASRKLVLPQADKFVSADLPQAELEALGVTELYRAENGAGYAVTAVAAGYHGEITALFGVDPEGRIAGVEVLSHTETQGLGERVTTEEFRAQFLGKSGVLVTVKGAAAPEGEIAAITGATISSNAMTRAANSALAAYQLAKGAR